MTSVRRSACRAAFVRPRRRRLGFSVLAMLAAGLASCRAAEGRRESIAAICEGREARAATMSLIDSVLPPAGESLAVIRNRGFELRFTFEAGATSGAAAGTGGSTGCEGRMGRAVFAGDLPEPIRGAASSGAATWRVQGDTVLLDLNPGTRDNNLFMVLPLRGGEGHWSLSTFAGEVASGRTTL